MVKKKSKIIWDDEAKRSLRSIYDYLKNKESITVAKKVATTIVKETRTLNQFSDKFSEEPYLKKEPENFRFKVVWSYKIIYEVTPDAIFILDIFHTSRNPVNISKK